jgi:glycosyltransferase involved in cell wall biosynthesis
VRTVNDRIPVIFVGAFRDATGDGGFGGQMYACRSLVDSGIGAYVRWLPIDSTMVSVPPPSLAVRGLAAARRVWSLLGAMLREPRARVLVFAGDGPSFVEKGTMVLLARFFGRHAVLCPRSGILLDDLRRSAFFRRFVPTVLRASSGVLCQSTQWAATFRDVAAVDPARLHVVPNWLRCEDYAALAATRTRVRSARTFLYLGWIEDFKGIFDLIDAVDARRDALAGARFIVCGSGSRLDEVLLRIRRLGLESRFEFRGWVGGAAKRAALTEADMLVLPSRREGMPNAVLEAMASGMPVIATAVGGVPDVVRDGVNGLVVPPADPPALGRALARCVSPDADVASWGLEALRTVRNNHDIDAAWPRVLRALDIEATDPRASAS